MLSFAGFAHPRLRTWPVERLTSSLSFLLRRHQCQHLAAVIAKPPLYSTRLRRALPSSGARLLEWRGLCSELNKSCPASAKPPANSNAEDERYHGSFKENIKTIPNLLTTVRIALAPVLGYLVLHQSFPLAFGLFVCAGVTDLMDGYIARTYPGQRSVLGSILDPMADKLLVSILAVSLTAINLIPVPLMVLIIGRDIGLVAAAFYIRYLSLPPPRTITRFFDLTRATASVHPSLLSKANTAAQLFLLATTLAAPILGVADFFLHFLWSVCAATTALSGVDYATSVGSFKILTKL